MSTSVDTARLGRDRVLEAALALADTYGLAALSLRRLAVDLGVTPMALYRYVESKDDLLDGIADLVLGTIEIETDVESWQERVRVQASSIRTALLRHPSVIPLISTRPLLTPHALRVAESLVGTFHRIRGDYREASFLYTQFIRFVLAVLAAETELGPARSEDERANLARAVRIRLETLPPNDFPNLVGAARYLASPFEPARAFDAALTFAIAGLERMANPSDGHSDG